MVRNKNHLKKNRKKNGKKLLCILLAAQLLFTTGCGNDGKKEAEKEDPALKEEPTVKDDVIEINPDTEGLENDVIAGEEFFPEDACDVQSAPSNGVDMEYYYGFGEGDSREYDYEEENRFYSAAMTPFSTFAADVDTASYSNIRSYLNEGNLDIPVSAVRIEEMINYFHYDYAEPKEGEPFSVNMELGKCPWNTEHYLVQIGLKTGDIDMENRKPSNFVFLIDTSGSMYDSNKLPLVQTAFTRLAENLNENDRISIVTYAGSDQVLLEGAAGNDTRTIMHCLDSLEAYGSTNGSTGINTAYELAEQYFIPDGNNRVILATDGDLNVGITDEGGLIHLIEEKKESGIDLSVLGFGTDNLKDNKLEALADHGNGNYAFIDSAFEAKRVLANEMGASLQTVAKDVKLQAEFDSGYVEEYRLIGYENRTMAAEDFQDDTVDGGEIGAGHRVTALYEVALTEKGEAAVRNQDGTLLTLSIRYKEPKESESKLLTYGFAADCYREEPSDNMRWAAAVAGFGMLLRESKYAGNLDYDMVRDLASSCECSDDPLKSEFIDLVDIKAGRIVICH